MPYKTQCDSWQNQHTTQLNRFFPWPPSWHPLLPSQTGKRLQAASIQSSCSMRWSEQAGENVTAIFPHLLMPKLSLRMAWHDAREILIWQPSVSLHHHHHHKRFFKHSCYLYCRGLSRIQIPRHPLRRGLCRETKILLLLSTWLISSTLYAFWDSDSKFPYKFGLVL